MDEFVMQEEFGMLPKQILRLYRRLNVTPAEHDQILAHFGYSWMEHESVPWTWVREYLAQHTTDGVFRIGLA